MKAHVLCVVFLFLGIQQSFSQNTWSSISSLPAAREGCASFTIGNKGYIGLGTGPEMYEYDPVTNVWTQKASYSTSRTFPASFAIGNKGYVVCGSLSTTTLEFDPVANTWTTRAVFPGTARYDCTGFSIGNKGYVGLGRTSTNTLLTDFYEYNPATNTWTAKASYPTALMKPMGFSIGSVSRGYIAGGSTSSTGISPVATVNEYNPFTNTWTARANLPATRSAGAAFSVGNKGYVVMGFLTSTTTNTTYEFDPNANTWTTRAIYPASGFNNVGFGIGSIGYAGAGYQSSAASAVMNAYTPASGLFVNPLSSTAYCQGLTISVPYTSIGLTFTAGNVFTAQLSDSVGNFASPVNIGTLTSTAASGNISATIPATALGTGYRIRVTSSTPSITGGDNGTSISITLPPTVSVTPTTQTICSGSSTNFSLSSSISTSTYSWTASGTAGVSGFSNCTSGCGTSIQQAVSTTVVGGTAIYTVTATGNGCSSSPATVSVNINPTLPVSSATAVPATICSGQSSVLHTWSLTNSPSTVNGSGSVSAGQLTIVSGNSSVAGNTDYVLNIPCAAGNVTFNWSYTTVDGAQYEIPKYVVNGVETTFPTYNNGIGTTPQSGSITVPVSLLQSFAIRLTTVDGVGGAATLVITNISVPQTIEWFTVPSGGSAIATGSIASVTPGTTGTVTYYVASLNPANPCPTASRTAVNVNVNPLPAVSATSNSICSGGSTSISFTSSIPSTLYTWTAAQQSGSTVTGFANQTGAVAGPIAQALTNTGNTNGVVRYTVTATAPTGCSTSLTVDQTVFPVPTGSATPVSICSGSTTSIALNPTVSGTTFTWTAALQSGTVTGFSNQATASSGPIAQTLTNTTTSPGVVRYTVTPTANGCAGSAFTVDVTVNPIPSGSATGQTICSGATTAIILNSTVSGATFSWTAAQFSGATVTGFSNQASFVSSPLAQTLSNTNTTSGVVRYTVTPRANNCNGATFTVDATVNPRPTGSASAQSICSGTASNVTLNSTLSGTTFTWTAALQSGTVTGFSNQATASTGPIAQTLTNTTNTPGVVRYTVTPLANGCTGNTFTVDVTVNPIPSGSASPQSICSGTITSIVLNSTVSGSTFSWTAAQFSGATVTGFSNQASFVSSPLTQTLSNTNTTAGVVRYTVTPRANACNGSTFTVDATVNPIPSGSASAQSICSGTASSVTLNSTVSGTTFTWTAALQSGTVTGFSNQATASSGPIAQTLTNTTTTPGVVRYTVTPTANSCPGSTFTVDVTVNPIPSGSATGQTICSGATTSITLNSTVSGSTFSWTAAQFSGATVTGFSNQASFVSSPLAQTLTNSNTTAGVVRYTVTPRANNCSGSTFTVDATVNPIPSGSASAQSICSGTASSVTLNSTVSGTTFTWTAALQSGTVTGFSNQATASSGPIAQTLTNTTTTPGVVRYTVTPTANSCPGSTFTVDVTVNPIPSGSASPQTICSGATTSITLNSTVSGSTFSWTAAQFSGATVTGFSNQASFVSGPLAQTLTNTNTTTGVVRYTVTPRANNCSGSTFTVDATVNPIPTGSASAQAICSGTASNVTLNSTVSGTTFTWTAALQSGTVTGFSNQATASTGPIAQTLTNTTTTPGVVRYTVTPTANSCPGSTFTVDVTVNPIPSGSASPQTICSDATTSITLNSTVSGSTFSWTAAQFSGATVTGFSNQASFVSSPLAQTLSNANTTAGVVRYTVTPRANNCSGSAFTVDATVNPLPSGTHSIQTICSGSATSINLSSSIPGSTYTWTAFNLIGGIITGFSDQLTPVSGPIVQTLTNTQTFAGVMRYSITPIVNSCSGAPFFVDVTVDPTPIGSASSQTICSGSTTSITLNSSMAGTSFTWTASQLSGAPVSGFSSNTTPTQNPIQQTLSVPSGAFSPGVVRYTIVPATATCTGNSFTVDVTVSSVLDPVTITNSNLSLCPGNTTSLTANVNSAYTSIAGSWGSPVANCDCPQGFVIVGVEGNFGAWADRFRFICRQLLPNGTLGSTIAYTDYGGQSGGGSFMGPAYLPTNYIMVGAEVTDAGGVLSSVRLFGHPIDSILSNAPNSISNTLMSGVTQGSFGGIVISRFAPAGMVITGAEVSGTFPAGIRFKYSPAAAVFYNYLWNTGATSSTISGVSPGNYQVTVTNGGCSTSSSTTVSFITNPTITISGVDTVCQGQGAVLTASGATSYSWSPVTGLNTNSGATVIATPSTTTTYTLTAVESGCTFTRTKTVNVIPIDVIVTATKTQFCVGDSSVLTATGANSYTWLHSGSSTPTLTVYPVTDTVLWVTGSFNGCIDTAAAYLSVVPVSNGVLAPSVACAGDSITLTVPGGIKGSYLLRNGVPVDTFSTSFDSTFTVRYGGNGSGYAANQTTNVRAIERDNNGNVYVMEGNIINQIKKFAPGSSVATILPLNNPSWLSDIAFDPAGNLFYLANNRVFRIAAGTTTPVQVTSNWEFQNASAIAVDKFSNLYVCDNQASVVKRYVPGNMSGTIVAGGSGGLFFPLNIEVDDSLNLYINNGQQILKWVVGAPSGSMYVGNGGYGKFILDSERNIISYDVNGVIRKWEPLTYDGEFIASDPSLNFSAIGCVAFDEKGNLLVSDLVNNRILRLNAKSVYKFKVDSVGTYSAAINGFAGCNGTSNSITVNPTPSLVSTETICEGDTIQVVNGTSFTWSPGSFTGSVVTPTVDSLTDFTVENEFGCTSIVRVYPNSGTLNNAATCTNIPLSLDLDYVPYRIDWTLNGSPFTSFNPAYGPGTVILGTQSVLGTSPSQFQNANKFLRLPDGTFYVADNNRARVLKFNPGSNVGTVVAGGFGYGNNQNQLGAILALAVDKSGSLYVSDIYSRVFRYDPGFLSPVIVAGTGVTGSSNFQVGYANAIHVDEDYNVYVFDPYNQRIAKWPRNSNVGQTVVSYSFNNSTDMKIVNDTIYVSNGNSNEILRFIMGNSTPVQVAYRANLNFGPIELDAGGNIYVFDYSSKKLCRFSRSGQYDEVLNGGNSFITYCIDERQNIYASFSDYTIKKFIPQPYNGLVIPETAGSYQVTVTNAAGCTFGVGPIAVNESPLISSSDFVCQGSSITLTASGTGPFTWQPGGASGGSLNATPVASTTYTVSGPNGCFDTQFVEVPTAVDVSLSGSTCVDGTPLTASMTGQVNYIEWRKDGIVQSSQNDSYNNTASTVAGGNGSGSGLNQLNINYGLAFDNNNNLYVADAFNYRIMKWAPGATSGVVVAGNNGSGPALDQLAIPQDIEVDDNGNVYVADLFNYRVLKFAPGQSRGVVVAGGNGPGTGLNQITPEDIAFDAQGNLYVSEWSNNRVLKFAPGSTTGVVVVGGNGAGSAMNQVNGISGLDVMSDGTIIIADYGNRRVVRWNPGATSGILIASSGNPMNGIVLDRTERNVYTIENWAGPGIRRINLSTGVIDYEFFSTFGTGSNQLRNSYYLTLDNDENMYISDRDNGRVQKYTRNNLTTSQFTPTSAGTYTVFASTIHGCVDSASITTFSYPQSAISGSPYFCSGSSTTLTSGVAQSYQWSTGDTTQSIVVNQSGTYTVTATSNGCATSSSINVTETLPLSLAGVTVNRASTCQGSPVTLTASILSGGSLTLDSNIFYVNASDLLDYVGCTGSFYYPVSSVPGIRWTDNSGKAPLSVKVEIFGGVYYYATYGSLFSTGFQLNGVSAGTYSTYNHHYGGCGTIFGSPDTFFPSIGSYNSNGINTLRFQSSAISIIPHFALNNSFAKITVVYGPTVTWNPGNLTGVQVSVSPAATTTYTIAANYFGCSLTDTFTLPVYPVPTITASDTTPICLASDSITLTASAGNQYLWSNGATTQSIVVDSIGTFTVNVDGCASQDTIRTSILPAPLISNAGLDTICPGFSSTLTAGFPSSISIDIPSSALINQWDYCGSGNHTNFDYNNYYAMDYGFSWTDNSNAQPSNVEILLSFGTNCFGGNLQASLNGNAPVGFFIAPYCDACSNPHASGGATNFMVTLTFPPSHYNANGVNNLTIQNWTYESGLARNPLLNNNVARVYKTVPFVTSNVVWSTGDTTASINVSAAGTYTATVSDVNGCAQTVSRTIVVRPLPVPSITSTPASFCNQQLTSSAAFGYLWSSGDSIQTIVGAPGNSYTVTVSDALGCTAVSAPYSVDPAPGNPVDYGINVWNVYTWAEGQASDVGNSWTNSQGSNNSYVGYYTDSTLNFNTANSWQNLLSPSSASAWMGCPVPIDNHSYAAKRKGFPCGYYSINIVGHDDEAQLWVNDVMVWRHDGCCDSHDNVWTGFLDGNSKVMLRVTEGGGASYGALQFVPGRLLNADTTELVCSGDTLHLDLINRPVTMTTQRFASSVLAYSSQLNNSTNSADQILGAPDQFPRTFTNLAGVWTHFTPDSRREFIELAFNDPSPINYIDLYQGRRPGTIDTVYVKNPNTGLFEIVYQASAASSTNNYLRITFPLTSFNVDQIRIAMNSPAVTNYSSIDAVSIGRIDSVNVLWSTGATSNGIDVLNNGNYTVTLTPVTGCTASETISAQFDVPPAPLTISASGTAICNNASVTLTSSLSSNITWSPGNQTTQAITVTDPGTYTVTYSNGGCTDSATQLITGSPALPPVVTTVQQDSCFNSIATLTATGVAPSGQVAVFDGSRYVEVNQNIPEVNFTIEMWIKTSAVNTGIFSATDVGGGHDRHIYTNSSGQLMIRTWQGITWNSGAVVTDNNWHHIALVVQTGIGQRMYVDGVLRGSNNYDRSDFTWQSSFRIGFSADAPSNRYNGSIDNVRIWSVPRTLSQVIGSQYFTIPSDTTGLVYNCTFNNGLVPIVGNSGTSVSSPMAYQTVNLASYYWTGSNFADTIAPSLSVRVSDDPITYTVAAYNNGCTGPAQNGTVYPVINVDVPVISSSGPLNLCAGSTVTLTSSRPYNNVWSTGDTTQSITVSASGIYFISVEDSMGNCGQSDPITVNVSSSPVAGGINGGGGFVCLNNQATFSLFGYSGSQIQWQRKLSSDTVWTNFGTNSPSVSTSLPQAGMYDIRAMVSNGACTPVYTNSVSIQRINTPETPIITSSNGTQLCAGQTTELAISNYTGDNAVWRAGSCSGVFVAAFTPTITVNVDNGTNTYFVRQTNSCGTSPCASITIYEAPAFVQPVLTSSTDTLCLTDTLITLNVSGGSTCATNRWLFRKQPDPFDTVAVGVDSLPLYGAPPSTGTYDFQVIYVAPDGSLVGSSNVVSVQVIDCNAAPSLLVRAYIQGYYENPDMTPVLANCNMGSNLNLCDSVTVTLYDTNLVNTATFTGIIGTNGLMLCPFDSVTPGSYYVELSHRSALTVWSANPVYIGANAAYDFTTDDSKAYGNNMVEVSPGVWAMWNGDVAYGTLVRDGFINMDDVNAIEAAAAAFATGYHSCDLNGDGVVESVDYSIIDNNQPLMLQVLRP